MLAIVCKLSFPCKAFILLSLFSLDKGGFFSRRMERDVSMDRVSNTSKESNESTTKGRNLVLGLLVKLVKIL
jgi:hypothetical protein